MTVVHTRREIHKYVFLTGGKRITKVSITKKHDNYIRLANVGVNIFNVGIVHKYTDD